jgi:hypothetical protein
MAAPTNEAPEEGLKDMSHAELTIFINTRLWQWTKKPQPRDGSRMRSKKHVQQI